MTLGRWGPTLGQPAFVRAFKQRLLRAVCLPQSNRAAFGLEDPLRKMKATGRRAEQCSAAQGEVVEPTF